MSCSRIRNTYKPLDTENDEDCSQSFENLLKKAKKKLREIENLKSKQTDKGVLSNEELEKISSESYWRNIINPPVETPRESEPKKPSVSQQKKQKKKAKERENKRNRQEEAKESEKRQQEERERREREYRERREREHIQQLKDSKYKVLGNLSNCPTARSIYDEFAELSETMDIRTTYRKLSRKYHPDKNSKKDTTLHQQIVEHLKEVFSK